MHDLYDNHWRYLKSSWTMKLCVFFSIALHAFVGYSLLVRMTAPKPKPIPVSVQIEFTAPPSPETEKPQVEKAPPPPPPPPPPPKPKVEKPKPKPKPPEPKVEKPKPKPKPKPPEPKVEKPKPKPKPPKPKPKPIEPVKPVEPPPEVVAPPQKQGIKQEALPHILSAWAGLVQRKVDSKWRMPGGVQVIEANKEVHISFWVNRDGKILGTPEIVEPAADKRLNDAAIKAIKLAEPLPKLPNEFMGNDQQVLYVFTLNE